MPFDWVEECPGDANAIHRLLSRRFRERRSDAHQDIESQLAEYDIDDEGKATFGEALNALEAGFYRSVCRVPIPEIGRVSRVKLHGNRLDRITSQTLLRKLAGQRPISTVELGGFLGLNLFRRLSEHLYEHVDDEDRRRRFAQEPVPNRHTAVHGLVVNLSMQNGLMAVFVADFIFQVLSL